MLDNAAHVGHTDDKVLVFFKSVPHVVTPDNMDTVILVSSMLRYRESNECYMEVCVVLEFLILCPVFS